MCSTTRSFTLTLRIMSPTPPPFRRPQFSDVNMHLHTRKVQVAAHIQTAHILNVSQLRTLSCSSSSAAAAAAAAAIEISGSRVAQFSSSRSHCGHLRAPPSPSSLIKYPLDSSSNLSFSTSRRKSKNRMCTAATSAASRQTFLKEDIADNREMIDENECEDAGENNRLPISCHRAYNIAQRLFTGDDIEKLQNCEFLFYKHNENRWKKKHTRIE